MNASEIKTALQLVAEALSGIGYTKNPHTMEVLGTSISSMEKILSALGTQYSSKFRDDIADLYSLVRAFETDLFTDAFSRLPQEAEDALRAIRIKANLINAAVGNANHSRLCIRCGYQGRPQAKGCARCNFIFWSAAPFS